MLTYLLTPAPVEARKRLPSHTNPELAANIRQQVSHSLCQHQGDWACYFVTQLTTFILPKGTFCSSFNINLYPTNQR